MKSKENGCHSYELVKECAEPMQKTMRKAIEPFDVRQHWTISHTTLSKMSRTELHRKKVDRQEAMFSIFKAFQVKKKEIKRSANL